MKRTPKVITYNNRIYYKEVNPYKYVTKEGLNGYKGGYWTYGYNNDGNLIKTWLFECVELSRALIELDFEAMLNHFKINY